MIPTSEDKACEVTSEINLTRAERLQQAILKKAFSDKLTATKVRVLEVNNVE